MSLCKDPVHNLAILQGFLDHLIADMFPPVSGVLADSKVEVSANIPSDLVQPGPSRFAALKPGLLASTNC